TNGAFDIANPAAPDFGWTTRGSVNIGGGVATLSEGGRVGTALMQPFFVPAGATTLRFTIVSATLGAGAGLPPDAFEAALLDARTLQPRAGVASLSGTDALLNIQHDGSYRTAPGVSILHLTENGGILGAGVPRVVQIDVSQIPADTLAVLSLDLLGFGGADSQ